MYQTEALSQAEGSSPNCRQLEDNINAFLKLISLAALSNYDGPIMSGHDSLAKRLCQVSPYASCIEPLIGLIPEIMERNDQLRPLWTAWRQNATPDLTPRQYFTRGEIKLLCDFVEYLYFASDAFARSARRNR